ncbi:hypothetical protein [Pelagibacterium montanilacus]|uniref:hypothetical protein n=1 Tax=Pelagibacterium montanilacus TaxID=2185280 RepID=UPI0013E0D9AA|nr:hypothetical protein [Pelagibacterium montanilacus]
MMQSDAFIQALPDAKDMTLHGLRKRVARSRVQRLRARDAKMRRTSVRVHRLMGGA